MILGFRTQIDGKQTCFPEKIITGLFENGLISREKAIELLEPQTISIMPSEYQSNEVLRAVIYQIIFDKFHNHRPKIHTIREDKTNRWHKDRIIDFFINVRQENMFRFAPKLPVKSTQRIYMSYAFNDIIEITIGSRYIYDFKEKEQIAINDGFDSYTDFFDYFYPIIMASKDNFYIGKIIHWTDFRYQ